MENFEKTFLILVVTVFIINLISDIYPSTKNKQTLLVAFSVITVFVCISPVQSIITGLFGKDSPLYNYENRIQDSKTSFTYETSLMDAMKKQVELELSDYLNNTYGANVKVLASISKKKSNEKNSNEISLESISITGSSTAIESLSTKEESIKAYVKEKYGVIPELRTYGED